MKIFQPIVTIVILALICSIQTDMLRKNLRRNIKIMRTLQNDNLNPTYPLQTDVTYTNETNIQPPDAQIIQTEPIYQSDISYPIVNLSNNAASVQNVYESNNYINDQPYVNPSYDSNISYPQIQPNINVNVRDFQQQDVQQVVQQTYQDATQLPPQTYQQVQAIPNNYLSQIPNNPYNNDQANIIVMNSSQTQTGPNVVVIGGPNNVVKHSLDIKRGIDDGSLSVLINEKKANDAKTIETSIAPVNEEIAGQLEDLITINDLRIFEEIIDHIEEVFEAFYNLMPVGGDSKEDGMDKAIDILKFLSKLTALVSSVVENKDQLQSDLHFLEDKLSQLSTNLKDMLRFFKLNLDYDKIVRLVKPFLARDVKFEVYLKQINENAEAFNVEIKKLVSSAYDISKIAKFFIDEALKLKESGKVRTVVDGLKKLDEAIMILVKLMNMRTNIKTSINIIKDSMKGVRNLKDKIQKALKSAENLAVYYQLEDRQNQSKILATSNSYILSTIAVGFIVISC